MFLVCDEQEDWSLFMVTKYRTIKLQMTEFDEEFSEEHAEGTEVRAQPFLGLS